jgi:hypothetical protein
VRSASLNSITGARRSSQSRLKLYNKANALNDFGDMDTQSMH